MADAATIILYILLGAVIGIILSLRRILKLERRILALEQSQMSKSLQKVKAPKRRVKRRKKE